MATGNNMVKENNMKIKFEISGWIAKRYSLNSSTLLKGGAE
jgi:hypothetical protein